MAAQDNAKTIRQVYEAFAKGDLVTIGKLFAPEIRWHVTGRSPLAGTYSGHEAVFAFFGRLAEMSGGSFTTEIHDLMASEDHVVVLARETGSRGDRHLQDDEAHVWHLVDGLATEFWGCPKDPYEVDAFWS
jgi:ketosteroid isomerase-like protein